MNKILISTILFVVLGAWTLEEFSPQVRINRDLKKLNLENPGFVTDANKRKKHRDVVLEIKKNFSFPADVLRQSEMKEYSNEKLLFREWKYEQEDKSIVVQEFCSMENKGANNFYYLWVDDLSAAKEYHYLSEETFGLVSYRINEETISVKKKDRYSKFLKGQSKFEAQVKEFISEK